MNRLYFGDNLHVLREHLADASVDLIYLDPPFNSKRDYNLLFKTPKGHQSDAQITAFEDSWHWGEQAEREFNEILRQSNTDVAELMPALRSFLGENDMMAYVVMMTNRLLELHRVLKPTGSLYLHVDAKMSAYVRLLLDALFGRENFRNEIAWAYRTGGTSKRHFGRKHDAILFYTASDTYTFHPHYERVRYRKKFFSAQQDEHGFYADVLLRDVWDIPAVINVSAQRTGYPTQKPIELLERIVRASSNEGDVVLDPFCGSGTALVAAQKLGRRWIGMDANEEAVKVAGERLKHEETK